MKRKEMIQLVIGVVILAGAGYLIFIQLAPAKSASTSKVATVPKITPINPGYDSTTLSTLNDTTKTRDFYQAPDLNSGLGNSQPFGSQ
jgi:hypothetical protein